MDVSHIVCEVGVLTQRAKRDPGPPAADEVARDDVCRVAFDCDAVVPTRNIPVLQRNPIASVRVDTVSVPYDRLVKELGIRIRRIHIHPVIHDVLALSNRVCPERREEDIEVLHHSAVGAPECERDGAAVAVEAGCVGVMVVPGLEVIEVD